MPIISTRLHQLMADKARAERGCRGARVARWHSCDARRSLRVLPHRPPAAAGTKYASDNICAGAATACDPKVWRACCTGPARGDRRARSGDLRASSARGGQGLLSGGGGGEAMSGAGGGGDAAGLQPGEDIRPHVGPAEATALATALYGLPRSVRVRQLNAYDDKNFYLQVPEEIKTSSTWQHGYVLKVLNALDSKNPERVAAQNEIMIYLGSKGIVGTQPIKNIHGKYYSIEKINVTNKEGLKDARKQHIVRLLTFQPGEILYNIPCTATLFYQVGSYIANLNILLKDFHHPGLDSHDSIWMLQSMPKLKKFTFTVQNVQKRTLATEVIDGFENDVLPVIPNLERGLIHGDFNEQNILVQKSSSSGDWYIHGVIDWGDCQVSCYVFELAITICYMMLQSKLLDPLEAPGHVIAGYITKRKLPEIEFQVLQKCICARLCQSLVLGAYSHTLDPTNQYLLTTAATGWELLSKIWNTSEEILYGKWKEIIQSYVK